MTEQMFAAIFGADRPKIEPVQQITAYRLTLTAEQAHALYNDIYMIARDFLESSIAADRKGRCPALFAVYDALYEAGVDGAGPVTRE